MYSLKNYFTRQSPRTAAAALQSPAGKGAAGITAHEDLTPAERKVAQQVKQIIEQDITKHYTIKALSQMVNMNAMSVKRAFKKVYKTTILPHLINCRLEFGYQQIIQTDEPIQNITRECGYVNPSHLNVLFKRKYDMEPGSCEKK